MNLKRKRNMQVLTSLRYVLILCILSVGINLAGSLIASALGLPLYLDTIGTVLAAALGGSLPGIAVGFFTNMIKAIYDPEQMYYCAINMITALCAVRALRRGAFRKPLKLIAVVPMIALVTGTCGAMLAWFLGDEGIGGTGAELAHQLAGNTPLNSFLSLLIVSVLLDVIDKGIVFAIALAVYKLIPEKVKGKFKTGGIWHSQLSREDKAVRQSKCRALSFRTKIILIVGAATILIAGAATTISSIVYRNSVIDEHIRLANGIVNVAAESIDAAKVDEYIESGDAVPGYTETEKLLYGLRGSSPDVEYIYAYKIMEDGCHVVFDLDTDEVEGSAPGEIIEFDESFSEYVPALLAGEEIEPIISNDKYGWLLTVYKPVYDQNGVCQCYAAVDISMNVIKAYSTDFLAKLLALLAGFFIIIISVGTWIIEHNLIRPINTMAYCAGAFAYNTDNVRAAGVERLKKLDIRTGDEIENLYHALVQTTEESMQYVADIQHHTETISQMQNGLIMVLADMVESRDQCTGDHVRKTAAYARIILEEMKARSFYKNQLTDQFIEDVVNAAPLHDIGKIHISDTILNKPGKLTDEEFEIMKQHTVYGSEIIERAIEMVPESGYLNEAKNLAEFHHEKWNGRGYPHGLSGKDIPLSARVMAVADVFDALVSRRSYKEPFSFEKAMSIIREDAGSHFDPFVAEAFLGAEERVREVAERFEDM